VKEREREVDDGKRVKDYSGRMQCISRENVMLIISERREMEDNIMGWVYPFSQSKYRCLVVRIVSLLDLERAKIYPVKSSLLSSWKG